MNNTDEIFSQIAKMKVYADKFMDKLIGFFGSPENDMPVLAVEPFPVYTFNGIATLSKVIKKGKTIYYVCDEKELVITDIPIEGLVAITAEIVRQYNTQASDKKEDVKAEDKSDDNETV